MGAGIDHRSARSRGYVIFTLALLAECRGQRSG
jgi:hypothetical protein